MRAGCVPNQQKNGLPAVLQALSDGDQCLNAIGAGAEIDGASSAITGTCLGHRYSRRNPAVISALNLTRTDAARAIVMLISGSWVGMIEQSAGKVRRVPAIGRRG
jgi:hypothetical protein